MNIVEYAAYRQINKAKSYTKIRIRERGLIIIPLEELAKDCGVPKEIMQTAWIELCNSGDYLHDKHTSPLYGKFETIKPNPKKIYGNLGKIGKIERYIDSTNINLTDRKNQYNLSTDLKFSPKTDIKAMINEDTVANLQQELFDLRKQINGVLEVIKYVREGA